MSLPASVIANLPEWLAFANRLADEARLTSLHYFRNDAISTELKGDASPVTVADREIERTLRNLIGETYSEHGICGEEFCPENTQADLQWVIDPIDGTRPFMAGIPTFVTLVSLVWQGQPILGLIDQPFLKERWIGAVEQASLCNGAPIQVAPQECLQQAMLGTTNPGLFTGEVHAAFQNLQNQCGHTICGGDGYLYGRLASGGLQLVCEAGLKKHDYAALIPIVEGAGGRVTDWQGKPITLESDGSLLASASKELHQQALAALRQ